MNSTNSYVYHSTLNRFPNSQQLNDLNSTRSSTTSCSTSHCLSNQCLECTTILSTRNLNTFIDQTTNSSSSSSYVQNYSSYLSASALENSSHDEQTTTRILSMNIPVENSNHHSSSILNIELDDNEQRDHVQANEYNEQLEVFVGFYRPGEYQRETVGDDDEEEEEEGESEKSDTQKKEEQSLRELISDDDEGNEDQDFIEEDFGPNQDDEIDATVAADADEQFNPNILENPVQNDLINANDQLLLIQIDEDEDQGFGAQFNDDCPSSDDENNHQSTLSLNTNLNLSNGKILKKFSIQHSQSNIELNRKKFSRQQYLSLPNLSTNSRDSFEKIEHFIIDDQQPITTISNLFVKKKSLDDNEQFNCRKKKMLRKSSEEILEISNQDSPSQFIVDDAVRDVERRVTLFDDEQARIMDNQSSIEQIVQYFQINIQINSNIQSKNWPRNEFLLDYLQYRSQIDISANDLQDNLLQYPEFASNIHCRFFPFWPPRDVDLLQWLSHWIKQGALPVAIMNMDYMKSTNHSSWQHRLIYGIEPRAIYLMNPIQIQSPQQIYEQLTVDSISSISRHDILQRYSHSPMSLTPLAKSKQFADQRWQTMNVLGQVVHVLREDRQLRENETRNIPYRPIVTHVRIPSTCSSGILIFSKDYNQLFQTMDLPLR